jgi:Zn-dependent protease with chaperone function
MPVTSRAFVKASILYLCLGAILGALMLINRSIPLGPAIAHVRTGHIVMLVVGWLTQLILGVAWWLFPPLKIGLRSDAPLPIRRGQTQRGSEPLFWATFVCLNVGVLLRAIFEPVYSWTKVGFYGFLVGISGLFLLAAAVSFVVNMWSRVRELGRGK